MAFDYDHDVFVRKAAPKGYVALPEKLPTMIKRQDSCPIAIFVTGSHIVLKCVIVNPGSWVMNLTEEMDAQMSSVWTEVDSDGDLELRYHPGGVNSYADLFAAISRFELDVNKVTGPNGICPVTWPG